VSGAFCCVGYINRLVFGLRGEIVYLTYRSVQWSGCLSKVIIACGAVE